MNVGFKKLWVMLAMAALPVMVQAQAQQTKANDTQEAVQASADTEARESVRQLFESRFPGIEVTSVSNTPFPGLFEIRIGMDLLYTNATAEYVLQGSLVDAKSRRDLT